MEYLEGPTSDFYISVISIAELFASVRGDEEEKALKQLLLAFAALPVTEKMARFGGLYRRDYGRSHGISLADALIAATSEVHGADLATFNRRPLSVVSRITVPYDR